MTAAIRRNTTNYGFNIINYDFPRWHTYEWQNWDILDVVLQASGIVNVKGIWINSTAYVVGERVVDSDDGSLWRVLVSHTSASSPTTFLADRTANPTYWELENSLPKNRGLWVTATAYSVNDIVRVSNAYYVCVGVHTSGVFDTDLASGKWELIFDADIAINSAVRWDVVQALTTGNKTQGRTNIAAVGYETQTLTDPEKLQALLNVKGVSYITQTLSDAEKIVASTNLKVISYIVQTLTTAEKTQALTNLGLSPIPPTIISLTGANVDVAIPSGAKSCLIKGSFRPSSGTIQLLAQLSFNGGASYANTGYNVGNIVGAGGSVGNTPNAATAGMFLSSNSNTVNRQILPILAEIVFGEAAEITQYIAQGLGYVSGTGYVVATYSGGYGTVGVPTHIRIIPDSGTLSSGKLQIDWL